SKIGAGKLPEASAGEKSAEVFRSPAMLKFFLTFILIATITSALLAQPPKPEAMQYTCVMHPEVVQDHPGKCPKCGMELVPMKKTSDAQETDAGAVNRTV